MARKYEMRRRAARQEETRQRIVAATVALHEEVGVIGTTISDIAARAGVERATVYRHFPDDRSLITACTSHYNDRHPLPDVDPWVRIADPVERLRTALGEIYAYHRQTERMMARTMPEIPRLPVMQEVIAPVEAHWARARDVLAEGWTEDEAGVPVIAAAVGHAIGFATWQSLVQEQRLGDRQAVEMMVALVRCLCSDHDRDTQAGATA
jgi:AcrR family transcriptional regulator